jgi:ABC-type glycerol-3-phosphate transport system substrate-binding protein
LWKQGKVGMRLGGTGLIGETITANPDFEWDLFVTPKHPRSGSRAVISNQNPMVVTSSTKDPEAGYKVVAFFVDRFAQDLVGKLRLNMPSLKASAADPEGWPKPPPQMMNLSLVQMTHAGSIRFHLNWMQWRNELERILLGAFTGQASVHDACNEAARIGDTLLKGP